MATGNSQNQDALDLAGLEDEVNFLLNEVDDLTGGAAVKNEGTEVDLELTLDEVDGLLEEWDDLSGGIPKKI